jgi:hypothetical protein
MLKIKPLCFELLHNLDINYFNIKKRNLFVLKKAVNYNEYVLFIKKIHLNLITN